MPRPCWRVETPTPHAVCAGSCPARRTSWPAAAPRRTERARDHAASHAPPPPRAGGRAAPAAPARPGSSKAPLFHRRHAAAATSLTRGRRDALAAAGSLSRRTEQHSARSSGPASHIGFLLARTRRISTKPGPSRRAKIGGTRHTTNRPQYERRSRAALLRSRPILQLSISRAGRQRKFTAGRRG